MADARHTSTLRATPLRINRNKVNNSFSKKEIYAELFYIREKATSHFSARWFRVLLYLRVTLFVAFGDSKIKVLSFSGLHVYTYEYYSNYN